MPERVFPRGRAALFFLTLAADGLLLPAASWLDVLCAGGMALLFVLAWFGLAKRFSFADGFALLDRLPRALARLADVLVLLAAVWLAVRSAGRIAVFLRGFILPSTQVWLITVVLLVSAWLLARHGPPTLALWALPTAWVTGGVIALSLTLSLPDWTLPRASFATFFAPSDTLRLLGTVFAQALPILLFSGYDAALPQGRAALTGVACGAFALSLTGLRAVAVLGTRCAQALPVPAYAAAGVFAIGDFLQRSEALFGAALTVCFLARCALMLTICRACALRLRGPRQPSPAPPPSKGQAGAQAQT